MSKNGMFSGDRPRRFGLDAALGGRGMEVVLSVALVLIIVGAIVMAFWTPGGSGPGERGKAMFYCITCEKEFEYKPDLSKTGSEEDMMMMMDPMTRPDCPFGDEDCYVVPMMRCPNTDCKKYFVSPAQEWNELMESGQQPEGDRPDEVCPHCKTNVREWRKAQRKKRK